VGDRKSRAQLDLLLRNEADDIEPAGAASTAPVRVLHVLTRIAGGGAEDNTLFTCNGLSRRGYEVDLAIGEENEPASIWKTGIDSAVRVFLIEGLRRNPAPIQELIALHRLRGLIRSRGYHIVHTHGSKAGILGRIAAAKEHVPCVIHGIHGISFSPHMGIIPRTLYRSLERWVGRKTTAFVCVGEDMRNKYLQAEIGSPNQYHIVYSGMNLQEFRRTADTFDPTKPRQELGIPTEATVIGMVSRMEERKQHLLFLEGIHRLHIQTGGKSAFHVLLVGDGPMEQEIRSFVTQNDMSDYVHFTGYRKDVETMFAVSDIIALTSKWEGLPRVLVQAAATGRPVVTFEVDGVHEIVNNGQTGFIVPQGDIVALSEKLKNLLENPDLRRSMGQTARGVVDERWSIEAMINGTDSVYRSLLSALSA
jgi:glycosyltransferase involved in cell wall biosynthesis